MNFKTPDSLHEIPQILKNVWHKSVTRNIISLYSIQFASYVLPLITVPYLVRVLGPAGYGTVAFVQGLIAYFTIFVDYGFALSATRKISIHRNDVKKVNCIVFSTWTAKLLFSIIGLLILIILVISIPKFQENILLFFILYGTTIGSVLFPIWLYQGMERMVYISVINISIQLIVVICVFTIIHRPEDYLRYAFLIALGSIVSGIIGAVLAYRIFHLHFYIPSLSEIRETIKEGWTLFLSLASISLYTAGNAFILGLFTSNTVVGYYSAAEKIIQAILRLLSPITQATYPLLSRIASESKTMALQLARRILVVMTSLGFTLAVVLFLSAPIIVRTVLGSEYEHSISIIRILCFLTLAIGINNVLGILVMLSFHHDKAFTIIVFCAGILNIVLAIILIPILSASGMAFALLISEIFIAIAEIIFLQLRYSFIPLHKIRGKRQP